jgi:hypothetical protein
MSRKKVSRRAGQGIQSLGMEATGIPATHPIVVVATMPLPHPTSRLFVGHRIVKASGRSQQRAG